MGNHKYHHGDLKNTLIETGLKVITEEGIAKLSIRYVANKIGVSHAAPYRHFKNKEGFTVAIALNGFWILQKELNEALKEKADDPEAQLICLAKAFIRFAVSHPDYYRVMYRDYIRNKTDYPELFQNFDVLFRQRVELIEECRRRRDTCDGKVSAKSGTKEKKATIDAQITAIAISSLLHGYASMIIDNEKDAHVGSEGQIQLITQKILDLI